MKNIYFLLLPLLMSAYSFGQTVIYTQDFETLDTGYTASSTEGSGGTDVFNRVNPNIGGNSSYIWAVEDTNVTPATITLNQIDVTGYSDFTFSIDMLTRHYNDWDDSDTFSITYSLDGGSTQNLLWVRNAGGTFNQAASLDTDFDGIGDCGSGILPALTTGTSGCTVTENTFATFSSSTITLSGNSTLDIVLSFNGFTSADEGIYLDNISVSANSSACSASLSAKTPVCDNITIGTDTYSTTFDFLNGTETDAFTVAVSAGSASVSTISADGLITVTGINEGTDVTITLTNENCTLTQTTVSPTCEPAITSCFDISNGAEKFEMFTVATNSDNDVWTESSGTYNMNGYCGGGCEEVVNTWLLFGPLDLTSVSDLALKFNAQENFGDTPLAINYTAAYSGCPDTTSWSSLQTITESDEGDVEIDLSALTGTAVFIGIQYYDDGVDGYSNWDLSNVELTTYNNCPVLGARPTSDCPTLSIVDSEQREFSIFPNPTSTGFVNIISAHSEAISVNVYDMLGKQVINETIANNRLNVSTLNAGVYIMKISQGNTTTTQKIVIK
ncbi:T9SS type A sorting domain-containing protein [Gaetbulibacter jejuensis]